MKKIFLLLLVLVLLGICGVGGYLWHRKGQLEEETNLAEEGETEVTLFPVQTITAEPAFYEDIRELTGTTEARKEVTVSAQVSGRIERIFFDLGSRVQRGDILLKIDDELMAAAVAQAEANVESTKATFVAAVNNYRRIDELHSQQIVSDEVMDNAMQQRDAATAAHDGAAAALDAALRNLRETEVRAPLSGTVVSEYVDAGENINAGQQVVMINDISKLLIRIGIPEEDINLVHNGDAAEVALPGGSDTPITGIITAIGLKADLATRTFPAEITVHDPEALGIYPGMVVTVRLVRRTFEDAIFIPHQAVREDNDQKIVFITEGGKAAILPVTTGASVKNLVEITSGIEPGQEVIISGMDSIEVGTPIEVKN